jgi:hypothetical protein
MVDFCHVHSLFSGSLVLRITPAYVYATKTWVGNAPPVVDDRAGTLWNIGETSP